MIYGHIANKDDAFLPPPVKKALHFLRNTDLLKLNAGEVEIVGREIYAQIIDMQTKDKDLCPLESHRRYIDIQYLASGREKIGFAPDLGTAQPLKSHLPARDIIFYQSVEHEGIIEMTPGSYAMFFPYDIHRPGINFEENVPLDIRKVVVKVDINLLNFI
ncbi:Toxin-antitoxin biofilm protein TabA [Anaerobiospirillum thomasii]|uniref:Toxin-antitoxin biofilm protein TabA n=1 Tax=Anaerobiospirillum thomasii TaxID=179995 RepID=A0A2X0V625_9GAMM|nr:YhcH/YjgK/YiaL family protein [Anaerobiospirillum thomasii]SPT69899.1 Toxin-antitoxin biofilm protein TabA [Anaerobiospirillum thomasii]SPT71443.1 Toxin-antitoxin biofilm protein TabA [Anaerobiospirillum thomasii]